MITAGVNDYISGHQVKWTTDIGFSLNEVSSTWGSGFLGGGGGSVGWRTDSDSGQVVLRTQLQLTF